jgi:hypothetical protein
LIMCVQSLDDLVWPLGGDPIAPSPPSVGDLIELGPAAGLPEGFHPFAARVTAVSSAGPDRVHLAVTRDNVIPERRHYASLLVAGVRIIERAVAS